MIMCELDNGKRVLFTENTICCVVESGPNHCVVYTTDGEMTIVKCSLEEIYLKFQAERK